MERPPKRLKGWKLDQSRKHPCEKDEKLEPNKSSPLCTRLLELWSLGKISAVQAAEIAHLAILEGSSSAETMALAKCGNFGQNAGSAHRDLVSHFCKNIKVCDPLLMSLTPTPGSTPRKKPPCFFPTFFSATLLSTTQRFSWTCSASMKQNLFGNVLRGPRTPGLPHQSPLVKGSGILPTHALSLFMVMVWNTKTETA